jgi:hypothetical protein
MWTSLRVARFLWNKRRNWLETPSSSARDVEGLPGRLRAFAVQYILGNRASKASSPNVEETNPRKEIRENAQHLNDGRILG